MASLEISERPRDLKLGDLCVDAVGTIVGCVAAGVGQ